MGSKKVRSAVVALLLSACLAGCSGGADRGDRGAAPATTTTTALSADVRASGAPVSARANAQGSVTLGLNSVASITGTAGAMRAGGEITATPSAPVTAPDMVADVPLTEVGTGVWVESSDVLQPLTVTFPAARAPDGEELVALHLGSDGIWSAIPGGVVAPSGGISVTTSDFSFVTWATTPLLSQLRKFINDQFTGRTDPSQCEQAPPWAEVIGSPTGSTHSCVRTGEPRSDGTEIAEVEIKSNRGTFQWVQLPPITREYLWVEGEPELVRNWIAKTFDSGVTILLPPGKRMTIGYRQPEFDQDFAFTTYPDNRALLLSVIYQLAEAGMDKAFETTGGWVVVATCFDAVDIDLANFEGPANLSVPDIADVAGCIIKTISQFSDDPAKAANAAGELFGGPGEINPEELTERSQALYKAGKFFKAVNLVRYVIMEETLITDALASAFGQDNATQINVTLNGQPKTPSGGFADYIGDWSQHAGSLDFQPDGTGHISMQVYPEGSSSPEFPSAALRVVETDQGALTAVVTATDSDALPVGTQLKFTPDDAGLTMSGLGGPRTWCNQTSQQQGLCGA